MIFTPNSPWQAYVDEAWRRTSEQNGFLAEEECASIPVARSFGDITCGEAVQQWASPPWDVAWSVWASFHMWDVMSEMLRRAAARSIAEVEPVHAAILFQRQPDLSSTLDTILWRAFADTLPVTAAKLTSDPALRAKNGGASFDG